MSRSGGVVLGRPNGRCQYSLRRSSEEWCKYGGIASRLLHPLAPSSPYENADVNIPEDGGQKTSDFVPVLSACCIALSTFPLSGISARGRYRSVSPEIDPTAISDCIPIRLCFLGDSSPWPTYSSPRRDTNDCCQILFASDVPFFNEIEMNDIKAPRPLHYGGQRLTRTPRPPTRLNCLNEPNGLPLDISRMHDGAEQKGSAFYPSLGPLYTALIVFPSDAYSQILSRTTQQKGERALFDPPSFAPPTTLPNNEIERSIECIQYLGHEAIVELRHPAAYELAVLPP